MKTVNLLAAALFLCLTSSPFQAKSQASQPTGQAQTVAKSWLIRLIPPRPNFISDATADEKAVMEKHLVYWKELNQKGVCLFGGPVLDPKGAYGILVVRAATLDDARALGEGDPSVKSGLNRIEVSEMRVVFVPAQQSQSQ